MVLINKEIKKFRIYMFFYWAMMLSVVGMYTMYILELGYSKREVGIAVTIYTMSSLVGQSFIGYLVDKFGHIKNIVLVSISMGVIVGIGFPFTRASWQIYLLILIWGFFVAGVSPLNDAWCINILKKYNQQSNFGRVRGFGSIGYGFSGALLGVLLQSFGWRIYGFYITAAVIIMLAVTYTISDNENAHGSNQNQKNETDISFKEAISVIFRTRQIVIMIIIMFTYNFAMRGIYNYLGILVGDFGGGALSLGLTYFFDASPEIVTFFLTSRLLKKFHSKRLILAAFVLQIIRLTVILIFSNAVAVISMGVLSGFAFGLVTASYKTYIYNLAPAKYKASCLSLSESIIGISAITSAPIFGFVFAKFGTNSAILFGLIINILAALVMLKDIVFLRKTA
ncbi:MFS transporter [Clostridium swellfunianum]|uniref:MFS transporter n=1 Tax=Clostridium swellfunianum TaxID=1367462 RepID=UPI002030330F|nr:MFS transporter [Clostridium swellfunianum]MCM0647950.1 MFS transporter [Clostridium swellfunianum]